MDIIFMNLRQMISYALNTYHLGKPAYTKAQIRAELKKILDSLGDED